MADWTFVLIPLLALPIVLLFRFVGCAKFSAAPGPSEEPADFDLAVSSLAPGVTQGNKTTVTVTVISKNGFNGATALTSSGASGVSAVFAPGSVTPTANGAATSTLTLEASPTAPTGSFAVTITGTATGVSGGLLHSVNLNLTVIASVVSPPPPTPDFSLALNPPSRTVARGGTATYVVNITRLNGFAAAVTLAANPGPGNFTPNPVTGATSTLSGAVPNNAPLGSTAFSVTGTSGVLNHTVMGTLIVVP